ncbi:MAG: hypothetical protein FJW27_09675 [Acidimicrobiia bacterium]|nr:hypothetical protein [Acidimicrobiia bacterium]
MGHRPLASVCRAAAVLVMASWLAVPVGAQGSKVPRTAWGKPDLSGVWDFRTITPLERPAELGNKEFLTEEEAAKAEQDVIERNRRLNERPAERTTAGGNVDFREDGSPGFYNNFWLDGGTKPVGTRRTSLVIDPPSGRLPALTPAAQRRAEERRAYLREHPADSAQDRSASDRCLVGFNAGPPLTPGGYNQNLQISLTKDHVALVTEMIHTARIVPLDGRPALPPQIRQWSGASRGHWEGDTLAIETANFNQQRGWRGATGSMRLIERLTRIDADTLEYKYTVIDPETWTSPWTAAIPLRRSELPMYEYACHEGNYSMTNILSGQRAAEKEATTKR